jgi:transposase-like protein
MVESNKAQQWAKRIAAFEGSGLSRRTWCQQEGLNPNTLDYWRSRLRRISPAAPSARANGTLIPVVVVGSDAMAASIEIALPQGTRVRAPSTVDAIWLSGLVRGLCGC